MYAVDQLVLAGLALVPIPRGHKGPIEQGWNLPQNVITDVDAHPKLTICTRLCALNFDQVNRRILPNFSGRSMRGDYHGYVCQDSSDVFQGTSIH